MKHIVLVILELLVVSNTSDNQIKSLVYLYVSIHFKNVELSVL